MQQRDLQSYISHFNNRQYDQQAAYYAPDVVCRIGTMTLQSPRQIIEFYADFHKYVDETVEIEDCVIGANAMAAIMPTKFIPRADYAKNGLLFKKGIIYEIISIVFYKLENGKIKTIRVGRHGYAEHNAAL